MMARQHGAVLWDGTYTINRKNDGNSGTNSSMFLEHKDEIIRSLKSIRDKTTLKDWRNGITGNIQFSAKIIRHDNEGEIGNCSYIQNSSNVAHCHQEEKAKEEQEINQSLPMINPLNENDSGNIVQTDSGNTLEDNQRVCESRKSLPIHSKTGVFLRLEIEKCLDLRILPVSLFSKRRLPQRMPSICPFVLIKLNNQEVGRTPTLRNTNNPVWFDEVFQIPICEKCKDLTVEVWEEIPPKFEAFPRNGIQNIGDFIGKCSVDIQCIIERQSNDGDGMQEFSLELRRWRYDRVDKENINQGCSCPRQLENAKKYETGDGTRNLYRKTVRVHPTGNSFRRKKKRLPSILVEKPLQLSKLQLSFKIKNPEPFRRKDIREMNSESNSESFMTSTYFKALFLMGLYLVVGVVGFSFTFERWSIRDSMYFSVVTFSTVGYGDIRPNSDGAKLFSCVFALMGIGIIGIALGFIGQNLVQAQIIALQRSQKKKEDCNSESRRVMQSFPLLRNLVLFICPIGVMTLLGSTVVGSYENWNWIDSIYWCIMTGTSVGYGDFVPRTNEMRWFSLVFIPLSVGCTSAALGKIANIFVEQEIAKANSKLLKREVTLEDLEIMNADGDGEVSLLEFVEHMLKVMHKVDQNLLDELHTQFEKLDADGSGGLQQDDLELLTERKLKEKRQQAMERYKLSLLQKTRSRSLMRIWSQRQISPKG